MPTSVLVAAVLLAVGLVVAAIAALSASRDLRDSLRWIEQLDDTGDDDERDVSEFAATTAG